MPRLHQRRANAGTTLGRATNEDAMQMPHGLAPCCPPAGVLQNQHQHAAGGEPRVGVLGCMALSCRMPTPRRGVPAQTAVTPWRAAWQRTAASLLPRSYPHLHTSRPHRTPRTCARSCGPACTSSSAWCDATMQLEAPNGRPRGCAQPPGAAMQPPCHPYNSRERIVGSADHCQCNTFLPRLLFFPPPQPPMCATCLPSLRAGQTLALGLLS